MKELESISVVRNSNGYLTVDNSTNYPLIGLGKQGAVFKLSAKRCVKIFAEQTRLKSELEVYMAAQGSPIMPKLYKKGSNYIILEYVKGKTLENYLTAHRTIPKWLVEQILFIYKEMNRIGFTRLDIHPRHIIITNRKTLKLIDHVNSFKIKESSPKKLFQILEKFKLLHSFLIKVKNLDSETYHKWESTINI